MPAAAQAVVDGSDRNVPPGLLRAAVDAAGRYLMDPQSAEFRGLKPGPRLENYLCGFVNAKDAVGVFVGYLPFVAFVAPGGESYFTLVPPPKYDIQYELAQSIYGFGDCPRSPPASAQKAVAIISSVVTVGLCTNRVKRISPARSPPKRRTRTPCNTNRASKSPPFSKRRSPKQPKPISRKKDV